jgi:hypothetical protein
VIAHNDPKKQSLANKIFFFGGVFNLLIVMFNPYGWHLKHHSKRSSGWNTPRSLQVPLLSVTIFVDICNYFEKAL